MTERDISRQDLHDLMNGNISENLHRLTVLVLELKQELSQLKSEDNIINPGTDVVFSYGFKSGVSMNKHEVCTVTGMTLKELDTAVEKGLLLSYSDKQLRFTPEEVSRFLRNRETDISLKEKPPKKKGTSGQNGISEAEIAQFLKINKAS